MIVNRLFVIIFFFALVQTSIFAQSVSTARLQALGNTVTVRGIVTNGPELGKIRYMQDGTAGIAAFPGAGSVAGFENAVTLGDSIEVTGTLVSYYGLLEITPIQSFTVISSNNPLPTPKPISLSEISEELESQLVEFSCVTFDNQGSTFGGSGSFELVDTDGETAKTYLRSGHPLIGSEIPTGPTRLRAVLSQFNDFQLLPRNTADFEQASCYFFTQKLRQTDITTQGFTLTWKTSVPSNSTLRIGTTPNPDLSVPIAGYTTEHSHVFDNLLPGTIYWVQVEAEHNGVTLWSEPLPFATRSVSTGQIKTFFNKGYDPEYANGYVPDGDTHQAVLYETIARIDAAQQTLDVAVYNNNRNDITDAIRNAHARGVRVRYVAALDASNAALDPTPEFPVLYGNEAAIMHNKIIIVDADISSKAWVMSGSLNWTNQNITHDFNNTLFIQDQSLARAYELEFEEMWGSDGALPDGLQSRFGADKRDNTPHDFIIGGHWVESYFSPSDQTTAHIETMLRSAQSEALFAAFSFTKNELGNALVDVHNAQVPVRGIMENISDSGAEYAHLLANGVAVRHHNLSGEFHHKYAVVDAYDLDSDPTVLTGSHNWSVNAETANDENTLLLHDPALAALFKAEFEKRWGEFPVNTQSPAGQLALRVFPNPVYNTLIVNGLPDSEGVLQIKNAFGQVLVSQNLANGSGTQLDISGLSPGHYFLTFVSDHAVASLPFQKI